MGSRASHRIYNLFRITFYFDLGSKAGCNNHEAARDLGGTKIGEKFSLQLSTFHNWIRWHLATENMNGGEEKVTVHQYLTNRRLFFCPSFLFSFALVYFL